MIDQFMKEEGIAVIKQISEILDYSYGIGYSRLHWDQADQIEDLNICYKPMEGKIKITCKTVYKDLIESEYEITKTKRFDKKEEIV